MNERVRSMSAFRFAHQTKPQLALLLAGKLHATLPLEMMGNIPQHKSARGVTRFLRSPRTH